MAFTPSFESDISTVINRSGRSFAEMGEIARELSPELSAYTYMQHANSLCTGHPYGGSVRTEKRGGEYLERTALIMWVLGIPEDHRMISSLAAYDDRFVYPPEGREAPRLSDMNLAEKMKWLVDAEQNHLQAAVRIVAGPEGTLADLTEEERVITSTVVAKTLRTPYEIS